MKKTSITFCVALILILSSASLFSQSTLTIEKIMQGEKFTGYSPDNVQWAPAGNKLYFSWNKEMAPIRSLYVVSPENTKPQKVTTEIEKTLPSSNGTYNKLRTKMVYSKDGDLFLLDTKTLSVKQITSTTEFESNPLFNAAEEKIIFSKSANLFSWDIATGVLVQLTDIRPGKEKPEEKPYTNARDKWLYDNQMSLIKVLAERKEKRDLLIKEEKALEPVRPKVIYTGGGQPRSVELNPDNNYITWQTFIPAEEKRTIVPNYVTESGYAEDIPTRSKVGSSSFMSGNVYIYDIKRDTVIVLKTDDIPGLTDKPDYAKDYPAKKPDKNAKPGKEEKRVVRFNAPVWSDNGTSAVVDIFSDDSKDRWIMLVDLKTGGLKLLDRQHDNAWIGGPGIGYGGSIGWLPDNKTIFFQSEETGYSHLYTLDVTSGTKKAITSGKYEVYEPSLSNDKKSLYFLSNEVDPGIRELYRVTVKDGLKTKLTNFEGGLESYISHDEKYFAFRVSYASKPWELYLLENKEKAVPVKLTESVTPEFASYKWRTPEFIKFKASDGTLVPARLYKNEKSTNKGPAVIFVHGAGYLQNAHRWWSSYSNEYMFHNFLIDNGYTVLDIDYRGSAGYGRDWRTAIYRFMGGKDLDDNVDGAKYLVEQCQVDPARIGLYGGSYGGFITLMAMFTKPDVFAAGAGLRSVTDWAHYNHGYTANILNTPVADSLAYVKSSPIYYAEGLKGALLMCHGMVDDNVHFQDVVRLSQRLIELGKDNWELAVYPVERHGFIEPSSWTDEYKRIYKLFEENLKAPKK